MFTKYREYCSKIPVKMTETMQNHGDVSGEIHFTRFKELKVLSKCINSVLRYFEIYKNSEWFVLPYCNKSKYSVEYGSGICSAFDWCVNTQYT